MLGHRLRMSHRSHIVRSDGWAQILIIGDQYLGQAFIIGIGLPFFGKYRRLIIALRSQHRFIIPISPFHQPNPKWDAALFGTCQQQLQIFFTVAQISLHHNPNIAPIAKFRLIHNLHKNTARHITIVILLHIDVNLSAAFTRQPQNGAQTGFHCFGGGLGSHWVKSCIKR